MYKRIIIFIICIILVSLFFKYRRTIMGGLSNTINEYIEYSKCHLPTRVVQGKYISYITNPLKNEPHKYVQSIFGPNMKIADLKFLREYSNNHPVFQYTITNNGNELNVIVPSLNVNDDEIYLIVVDYTDPKQRLTFYPDLHEIGKTIPGIEAEQNKFKDDTIMQQIQGPYSPAFYTEDNNRPYNINITIPKKCTIEQSRPEPVPEPAPTPAPVPEPEPEPVPEPEPEPEPELEPEPEPEPERPEEIYEYDRMTFDYIIYKIWIPNLPDNENGRALIKNLKTSAENITTPEALTDQAIRIYNSLGKGFNTWKAGTMPIIQVASLNIPYNKLVEIITHFKGDGVKQLDEITAGIVKLRDIFNTRFIGSKTYITGGNSNIDINLFTHWVLSRSRKSGSHDYPKLVEAMFNSDKERIYKGTYDKVAVVLFYKNYILTQTDIDLKVDISIGKKSDVPKSTKAWEVGIYGLIKLSRRLTGTPFTINSLITKFGSGNYAYQFISTSPSMTILAIDISNIERELLENSGFYRPEQPHAKFAWKPLNEDIILTMWRKWDSLHADSSGVSGYKYSSHNPSFRYNYYPWGSTPNDDEQKRLELFIDKKRVANLQKKDQIIENLTFNNNLDSLVRKGMLNGEEIKQLKHFKISYSVPVLYTAIDKLAVKPTPIPMEDEPEIKVPVVPYRPPRRSSTPQSRPMEDKPEIKVPVVPYRPTRRSSTPQSRPIRPPSPQTAFAQSHMQPNRSKKGRMTVVQM